MPRPIPVFVFALAAYAATSNRAFAERATAAPAVSDSGDMFAQVFRLMSRHHASRLIVKVALDETLARAEAASTYWLSEVVETTAGFQGRIVIAPARARRSRRGERLAFTSDQVRGWSVSVEAAGAPRTRERPAEIARQAGPETA